MHTRLSPNSLLRHQGCSNLIPESNLNKKLSFPASIFHTQTELIHSHPSRSASGLTFLKNSFSFPHNDRFGLSRHVENCKNSITLKILPKSCFVSKPFVTPSVPIMLLLQVTVCPHIVCLSWLHTSPLL